MKTLKALIKRNIKLFFKDKGMFLTSLITPCILLILYISFLGNVYKDSFLMTLPEGFVYSDKLVNGYVGAQLISSILAVSCVTVSFCSNMLMVQDRANGVIRDLTVSPLKPYTLAVGYYLATLASTLMICFFATGICLVYCSIVGFYMSFADVVLLILDVFLLVMFGTALSSVISFFLTSQGQISAVGTMVSSCYGFVCGAYMPISQFSEGLQKVVRLLPGTYGTSLVREHSMRGVLMEMKNDGFPEDAVTALGDVVDCNMYMGDTLITSEVKYGVLVLTIVILLGAYIAMNILKERKRNLKNAKK